MLTSLATTLYLPRRESASVSVSTVPGATKGASTIAARDRHPAVQWAPDDVLFFFWGGGYAKTENIKKQKRVLRGG